MLFEQAPLIGTGTSGFNALTPEQLSGSEYPHNAILQIAAEYGLVGLAICGGLILLALFRPAPGSATRGALRVLLLYYLFNAMVSGNIMEDRLLWGVAMLLLMLDPLHSALAASAPDPVASLASDPLISDYPGLGRTTVGATQAVAGTATAVP